MQRLSFLLFFSFVLLTKSLPNVFHFEQEQPTQVAGEGERCGYKVFEDLN